ncbi:hypothetical protein DUNSADRAFT_14432 [Dunaliella salina]|uniref:Encoded protein n=1 Tax=Dunaliella salina TaxID=3046 RepID=A0ABQ7H9I8_DUNSA|nr:hypothetical protein DUNSADRAFT_14432 [Dunaliella salina]|eukprot:KAF5843516.1 hypothetical protein DUNSADRAFT_14432 [Dunaliella salina]
MAELLRHTTLSLSITYYAPSTTAPLRATPSPASVATSAPLALPAALDTAPSSSTSTTCTLRAHRPLHTASISSLEIRKKLENDRCVYYGQPLLLPPAALCGGIAHCTQHQANIAF